MSWAAVIVGGAALVGGVISSKGAKSAARTQAGGADRAADVAEAADLRARADLQPFRDLGGGIAPLLSDFVKEGPETQLERTQGFTDIQKSAAAGPKGLRSGNTLQELTAFNNTLNARNRQQRFNELFNLVTLGANAAARQGTNTLTSAGLQGDFITQGANARAAGQIGQANAITSGLNNLAFLAASKI